MSGTPPVDLGRPSDANDPHDWNEAAAPKPDLGIEAVSENMRLISENFPWLENFVMGYVSSITSKLSKYRTESIRFFNHSDLDPTSTVTTLEDLYKDVLSLSGHVEVISKESHRIGYVRIKDLLLDSCASICNEFSRLSKRLPLDSPMNGICKRYCSDVSYMNVHKKNNKSLLDRHIDAIDKIIPGIGHKIRLLIEKSNGDKPSWTPLSDSDVLTFIADNYEYELSTGLFSLADLRRADSKLCKAYENHLFKLRQEGDHAEFARAFALIPRARDPQPRRAKRRMSLAPTMDQPSRPTSQAAPSLRGRPQP